MLIKEGGVQLTLTIVDTPGFGDAVDNSNWSVFVLILKIGTLWTRWTFGMCIFNAGPKLSHMVCWENVTGFLYVLIPAPF